MNYEILRTQNFDKWLKKLKDRTAVKAIASRLDRAANGNFGDSESVGQGVSEMRIFVGKGYRVYFIVRNSGVVVLLCGGDKSTQKADIQLAKFLAKQIEV